MVGFMVEGAVPVLVRVLALVEDVRDALVKISTLQQWINLKKN